MRAKMAVLLIALLVLGIAACGGIPTSAEVYRIFPGTGIIIQPGVQAGYSVTASVGGSYRLVWTGDTATSDKYRNFSGAVWTPGAFSSIIAGCNGACPLEAGDVVASPVQVSGGQRIDFHAMSATDVDGFDFMVSLEPVYFDLRIDGNSYPNMVFYPEGPGRFNAVAAIPFGLTSN